MRWMGKSFSPGSHMLEVIPSLLAFSLSSVCFVYASLFPPAYISIFRRPLFIPLIPCWPALGSVHHGLGAAPCLWFPSPLIPQPDRLDSPSPAWLDRHSQGDGRQNKPPVWGLLLKSQHHWINGALRLPSAAPARAGFRLATHKRRGALQHFPLSGRLNDASSSVFNHPQWKLICLSSGGVDFTRLFTTWPDALKQLWGKTLCFLHLFDRWARKERFKCCCCAASISESKHPPKSQRWSLILVPPWDQLVCAANISPVQQLAGH